MGIDSGVMQAVTLAIAVLGAVLGVLNAWRNWVHDRLRVRVDVSTAMGIGGTPAIRINIRNLSRFDVTITHIGLHCIGRKRHMQLWQPMFARGEALPVRLESRASSTVVQALAAMPEEDWLTIECVYVTTACGNEVTGGKALFGKHGATIAQSAADARL